MIHRVFGEKYDTWGVNEYKQAKKKKRKKMQKR